MSWRAEFMDGPLAGPDHVRTLMAPDPPERMAFAPLPGMSWGDGWIVVGVDGLIDQQPAWPGQVVYRIGIRAQLECETEEGDQGTLIFQLEAEHAAVD